MNDKTGETAFDGDSIHGHRLAVSSPLALMQPVFTARSFADDHATAVKPRCTTLVLDTPIDVIDWPTAIARILEWAAARESRFICLCNVHSVVAATKNARLRDALRAADMTTPDGAPVAWQMRHLGHANQRRISGPDLMMRLCEESVGSDVRVYLLGGLPSTLAALDLQLRARFAGIRIVGTHSPPFREPTADEDEALVSDINNSGATLLFVGLGCPKQEQWMLDHRTRVRAVMLGVGAAFDFHAGTVKRAPTWMQHCGLEWLYRLASEPRRLWKRYLVTNTAFVILAVRQLLARSC